MTIEAAIFDFGKVLSMPPSEASWQRFAAYYKVPRQEFEATFWALRDSIDSGENGGRWFYEQIAARLNRPMTPESITQLVEWDNAHWGEINWPVFELAKRIKARGYRMAILSNIHQELADYLRQHSPLILDGVFDEFTCSCEQRQMKPAAPIYLHCCEQVGVKPAECFFIDDRQVNLDGAAAVGMSGYLFTGNLEADLPAIEAALP
jgi:putative hydrolase of the HAD superfamily